MLIPNANHLYKISLALKREFKESDLSNMFIIFELDEESLNKVNEDFYYRSNPDAKPENYEIADEVDVKINRINFRYIKKEDQ